MTIQTIATISKSFKAFLQGGAYEPAILELMNKSKRVFPLTYELRKEQSHGEPDFIGFKDGQNDIIKFDAKLPFDKKEGELICRSKSDFTAWFEFMLAEVSEFSNHMITNRGIHNVNETKLFKTIDKRLKTIRDDENAIFFFPYPITHDGESMIFTQMASDILSVIFCELMHENKIKNRRIYAIYPSMDQKMTLRCLNNNAREYIASPEISQHISYEFRITH